MTDAKHVSVGTNDFVIVGMEDGSLHMYNLTQNKGKSYAMPPQATDEGRSIQSPYDQFAESNYEHHDAIVSIELNTDFNVAKAK